MVVSVVCWNSSRSLLNRKKGGVFEQRFGHGVQVKRGSMYNREENDEMRSRGISSCSGKSINMYVFVLFYRDQIRQLRTKNKQRVSMKSDAKLTFDIYFIAFYFLLLLV